jgi:hypothetical protein
VFPSATRVLRLAFSRPQEEEEEPAPSAPERAPVEFGGFSEDCVFSGYLDLDADRLSDLLNECDEVDLVNVAVQRLDNGEVLAQERLTVMRSELIAVRAGEPRGNPNRRRLTRQTPVVGLAGPYTFEGFLHSRRGADPGIDLGRRGPMVPLTDATIRFTMGSERLIQEVATLIVNRDVLSALRPASHGDLIASA